MSLTGYLAPVGREEALLGELQNVVQQYGRLFLASGSEQQAHWAQNIWHNPQILPFTSISEAAKKLRSLQGLWALYPYNCMRRAELIQKQLPYFSAKPLPFPAKMPTAPLGAWTLLDNQTLLAAPSTSTPLPHGEFLFEESQEPPSRAYLKLWEVFSRIGRMPKSGERCLDLGASPGSWTWVLQKIGAKVIAVDRAALDPAIASLPHVECLRKDAFSLYPKDLPHVDWVFSDVAAYPEKLLGWIRSWLDAGSEAHFICTLKFQGNEGYGVIQEFEKIPDSKIFHLFHNKHELTWILLRKEINTL